jgi:hypothetical protein
LSNKDTELDFEEFAKFLASSDGRIVFIGVVDSLFKLRYSNFREDAKLYTDLDAIRNFITMTPRLVMNEVQKLEPILGEVDAVLVIFKNRVLVFSHLEDYVIVVGFGTDVPTPFPEYVAGLIKNAAKRTRTSSRI